MAKTIDECCDEIFTSHKNVGNLSAWRTKKSRFYDHTLSQRAKEKLLEDFGYEAVEGAKYAKKKE